jgi:hypothetical protein
VNEITLWILAGLVGLGLVNLMLAAVVLRRRERALGPSAVPVVEVLAFSLIVLVLMAAIVIDVQLIIPPAPAIGRAALYILGALTTEVMKRTFAILPNTPRWLPRALGLFEVALLVLAVVGIVLAALLRLA